MSRHLFHFLAECDPFGQTESRRWHDFIMLRNMGGVAPSRDEDRDYAATRGFNVLVLDKRGRPWRYCKCRHASHQGLRSENSLLQILGNDSRLTDTIPRTRGAQKAELQVQVGVFVPGVQYRSVISRLSLAAWKVSAHGILASASVVSDRARAIVPRFQRSAPLVSPFSAASSALGHLASWDVRPEIVEALEAALRRTPPFPSSPQHGDLWAPNVLRYANSWWILDFEMFGNVQVPMYDVYHFIRTGMRLREPGRARVPWIDRMAADDAAVRCSRSIIRGMADHYHLSPEQAVGAAVFYLVHLAATFRASGRKKQAWMPLMVEVDRIGAHLRAGSALDRMLLGTP